jgi:hypothetical protein
MTDEPLNRRRFLVSLATAVGGGVALVISIPGCRGEQPYYVELTEFVTDPASARILGDAYLQLQPAESDVARLVAWVFPALSNEREPPARDAVAQQLLAQIRADFDAERIVRVGGWVLSRSEARLFALATFG